MAIVLVATSVLRCKGDDPSRAPAPHQDTPAPRPHEQGYRVAPLGETHALEIRVRFTGIRKSPVWPIPAMVRGQCGGTDHVEDKALTTDAQGGVGDVVAWLDDIHGGAPLPPESTLVQDEHRCAFAPHVMAVPAGGTLRLTNSDPANHAVRFQFSTQDGRDSRDDFTKTIPAGGSYGVAVDTEWAGRVARVSCPIHLWMWSYVHFFDHPYFAVTHDGLARIPNIPTGAYHLSVWHEGLQVTYDSSLRFPPAETARVAVEIAGADVAVAFTMGDDGKLRSP